MRKKRIIIFVLTISLGLVYIQVDNSLYYYGESKYNIYNYSLPLGMEPDFWGTDVRYPTIGFVIEDKYGFIVIGKENVYNLKNDTIKINQVLEYGFRKEELIAFVEDENKNYYYVHILKNHNTQSKKELIINVRDDLKAIDYDAYEWVEVKNKENYVIRLKMIRNYLMILLIILILVQICIPFIIKKFS